MNLRPYQLQTCDAIRSGWRDWQKQLCVLPTGSGKTIIAANVSKEFVDQGERVLFLAHREELLTQTIDKFSKAAGLWGDLEKAEFRASRHAHVVVGSVQTFLARGDRWPTDHFGLIIVDEAHHVPAESYQRVLKQFDAHAKVLGITATPDRADKKQMGTYFQNIAIEVSLFDLIKQGYLSRIHVKAVPLKIDLAGVKSTAGDYDAKDLGEALAPYLHAVAASIGQHAAGRRVLAFLPLIATSQAFVHACLASGTNAMHVDGNSPDRKDILASFAAGEFQLLSNAMLLCLDTETEILTRRGFLRHDQICEVDEVANWNPGGNVFFERPLGIVRRELSESEHMVSIHSRTINLRVTNTHRMLVACKAGRTGWKKIGAQYLRSGHVLPGCGVAGPCAVELIQEKRKVDNRTISASAYNLRKHQGYDYEASFVEAARRQILRASLRWKQPYELSLDECRLVGFWIADGTQTKLQSGGVEYVFVQSLKYPKIISWFDRVLSRLRLNSIKKERLKSVPHVRWSLCRGTGSGSQFRFGIYSLEPYLRKEGTDLFWGLNESQFDALVEGYWMGDGWHGQADNGMPSSLVFNDTKKPWIEMLCAIGSVRGWRCAMFPLPSKNPKHRDQWRLRMIKGMDVNISCRTPIKHEAFKPEMVWCVRTSSKNIITRRKGKVVVMGNTEGFDDPGIDCIVNLRPTRSRPLYAQICGRGTRVHPGKENLLLLDFLWQHERHNLIRPAHLVASTQELADEMVEALEKQATGGQAELDLEELATEASRKREEKLRRELEEKAKRKQFEGDAIEFCLSVGAMAAAEWEDVVEWHTRPPSEAQLKLIAGAGIAAESIKSRGHASAVIEVIQTRRAHGLATPKQVKLCKRLGHAAAESITKDQASEFISSRIGNRKKWEAAA